MGSRVRADSQRWRSSCLKMASIHEDNCGVVIRYLPTNLPLTVRLELAGGSTVICPVATQGFPDVSGLLFEQDVDISGYCSKGEQ